MHITTKNLERLFRNCKYQPEEIGKALLRAHGYKVHDYIIDPSVYVYSKDGKKLLSARTFTLENV